MVICVFDMWDIIDYAENSDSNVNCWKGSFHHHRCLKIWTAVPLCVLWTIWCEKNRKTFDAVAMLSSNP